MVRHLPKFNKISGQAGTTLLEMVFAIGGLAAVMGAVLAIYALGLETYRDDAGGNQARSAAARALGYIKQDLRNANAVKTYYSTYTTDDDTIVISVPAYDSTGIIIDVYDHIIYEIGSQNSFTRTTYPGSGSLRVSENKRVLVRGISELQLMYTAHEFPTHANGTFTLASQWTGTPTCLTNGTAATSTITYNLGNHTASIYPVPASGDVVEFAYKVAPGVAGSNAAVSDVNVTVTAVADSNLAGTAQIAGSARLRNN